MNRFLILMILSILYFNTSCKPEPDYSTKLRKHNNFISLYYNLDTIKASVYQDDNFTYLELFYEIGEYLQENRKKQIDTKHSDLNFNYVGLLGNFYSALSVDFQRIEIFSNKQFNMSHPPKSQLSDIVKISTASPYKYIKSGYKSMYYVNSENKNKYPLNLFYPDKYIYGDTIKYINHFPWHLIEKKIDNLQAEDLILIGQPHIGNRGSMYPRYHILAVLKLPEPEEKGKHTISITFITDDAVPKLYRTTVEVDFE